ncbi:MAG: DMT family transporter [Candidatus Micrarchaeota archaeon]|nr:DMT family transporter [Candidatus Micrarchaeota archaeon]MDE1859741.1 DMT family transporter [Candidatus Micrarchaeota archaeon]
MLSPAILAAFMGMIIVGTDSAISKYILKRMGKYRYTVIILGIGILPMLCYVAFVGIHHVPAIVILLSIFASVFLGGGYLLYYKALETQQITHVAALGEIQPAILILFGVSALGESVSALSAIGAVVIIVGTVFVLTAGNGRKFEINRLLLPIVFANFLWAVYWVVLTYAIRDYASYALPLLIARAIAFVLVLGYALMHKKIERQIAAPTKGIHVTMLWFFVLMSGLFDGGFNILQGTVINANVVALGNAIIAAGPLLTAVIGRYFFGDKLTDVQKAGVAIAVIGAVAIGFG